MRKFNYLLISFIYFVFPIMLTAQENPIDEAVRLGTELHDQGKYEEAIEKYQEALELQPNNSLALYEMSYSYLALKDYKNAQKYSQKVIDNKSGHELHAYVVLGTALDLMGNTKKSIDVYEKALEKFDHYLLHYNHAVSCLAQGKLDKAYNSTINSILKNNTHASSHLLLSNIMEGKGSRVKSVLPLYYFLLVEPNSSRSKPVYEMLTNKLNYGVKKTGENNIDVTIPINSLSKDEFSAAELSISLLAASDYTDEASGKTETELFAQKTHSLFSVLGELKDDKEGFWWDFYVTFFYNMVPEKQTMAFCHYISYSSGKEEVFKWIEVNREEFEKFLNSMK